MSASPINLPPFEYLPLFKIHEKSGTYRLKTCELCAAVVFEPDEPVHTAYHEKLIRLIVEASR
jgi:hypothetical protein